MMSVSQEQSRSLISMSSGPYPTPPCLRLFHFFLPASMLVPGECNQETRLKKEDVPGRITTGDLDDVDKTGGVGWVGLVA